MAGERLGIRVDRRLHHEPMRDPVVASKPAENLVLRGLRLVSIGLVEVDLKRIPDWVQS